jgi:glycosyltransferase involved in cell wall biosynthesis
MIRKSNLKNLLVINYVMDNSHQVLSHQVEIVNQLSRYFDKVTVLTGDIGTYTVEPNVDVISYYWKPGAKISSSLRFFKIFVIVIYKNNFTSIFSHMTTIQSALIAPIAKIFNLKHYLWYAHVSKNIYLVFSSLFVDGIITSTYGSCPIKSKKVHEIGQMIDSQVFLKSDVCSYPISRFIHIGRFDSSKKIEEIILTIKRLRKTNKNFTLEIVGSPSSASSIRYSKNLRVKFNSDISEGWLIFSNKIDRSQIPDKLKSKDCFIHAFEGSLDKTLIEATLVGIPVVTSNKEYLKSFGSWGFQPEKSYFLLEQEINALLKLSFSDRKKEVMNRYRIALENHELKHWTLRLVDIIS